MSAKNQVGAAENALHRYETYRTAFKRVSIASMVMAATTFMSVTMAYWAVTHVEPPKYFIAREDGGIIPVVPVDQPYLTNGQVTNFAVEAITASLTLDFSNMERELASASDYFERPNGWTQFLNTLTESGTLDFIRNNRVNATTVANGAVVVGSGMRDGRYTWIVQVPITITYESASQKQTSSHIAELMVARLPTWQTANGIGITRVNLR